MVRNTQGARLQFKCVLADNAPSPGEAGHTTWVYVPYSFQTVYSVGSFTSHKNQISESEWDGFSSLSEKTRKSNRLQMPLQR